MLEEIILVFKMPLDSSFILLLQTISSGIIFILVVVRHFIPSKGQLTIPPPLPPLIMVMIIIKTTSSWEESLRRTLGQIMFH